MILGYPKRFAGNYIAVESDPSGGTNQVLRCKQGGDLNYARSIDINVTQGVVIGFKWRRDAYIYHSYQSAMGMDGHYMWTARYYVSSPQRIMFYDGTSYQDLDPDFYWTYDMWYSTEIQTVGTILNYTDCSDGSESIGDLRTSPYAGLQWFQSFADYKNAYNSGFSERRTAASLSDPYELSSLCRFDKLNPDSPLYLPSIYPYNQDET